jgi:hypothetical protein
MLNLMADLVHEIWWAAESLFRILPVEHISPLFEHISPLVGSTTHLAHDGRSDTKQDVPYGSLGHSRHPAFVPMMKKYSGPVKGTTYCRSWRVRWASHATLYLYVSSMDTLARRW